MASILDKVAVLNVENFEGAIAVGRLPTHLMVLFAKDSREMDEWCMKTYGNNFQTTYEMVRQAVYCEFLDTVKGLGYRGNPSALNIINEALNEDAKSSVVKIVFDNNVATESEEEAEDD